MTYENVVQWVKRADYDLKTAFAMQDAARYLYVVFMCQQALEKILKAIAIFNGKDIIRTHNLVRLAEYVEIDLDDSQTDLLAEITPFAIEARYGEYKD